MTSVGTRRLRAAGRKYVKPKKGKPAMTDAPELLPCPFCGSDKISYSAIEGAIECENCWVCGPFADGNTAGRCKAVENWNTCSDLAPTWRPIEEAPKDGTEILIGGDYSRVRGVAWARWENDVPTPAFMDDGGDSYFAPTHWMPLPQPPKE